MKQNHIIALLLSLLLLTAAPIMLRTQSGGPGSAPRHAPALHIDTVPANGTFTLLYPPDGAGRVLLVALYIDIVLVALVYLLTNFPRRSTKARVGITLLLLPVTFAIAETAVTRYSTTLPGVFQPDPWLMWRIQPDLHEGPGSPFSSNALGLRGDAVSKQKPADVYRVLVVGDSAIFGHGVHENETFSARLQAHLAGAKPGKRIEVLNAAVPGYTTWQGLTWLRREGVDFDPDWIIAAFNNDAAFALVSDRQSLDQPAWVLGIKALLYRSVTYLVIRKSIITGLSPLDDPDVQKDMSAPTASGKSRVPLDDFKANLQAMLDIARAGRAGFTILVMPRNRTISPHFSIGYREAMLELASQGVKVPDYFDEWSRDEDTKLFIEGDPLHPNAAGHDRLARAVADVLRTTWSATAPASPSSGTR